MKRILCAAFFAALALFSCVQIVWAQDVLLTSRDGTVEISGTLLGFDGELYRVQTDYGELTIEGAGVDCEGPGCPNLGAFVAEIDLSGAAEMGRDLLPALIEAFAFENNMKAQRTEPSPTETTYTLLSRDTGKTQAIIYLHLSTSDEGFADLLTDQADIVMSLREITSHERKLAREAGMGDMTSQGRARVLALDALVAIVSNQNPVNQISLTQLAQIFSGDLDDWEELGPQKAEITPYMRDVEVGPGRAALQRLLRSDLAKPAPETHFATQGIELATRVSVDPFGIGLASRATTVDAKILTLSGSCERSLRATRRNIKTEDYPLTAPMFLYLPARRLPKIARDFLSYTRSPAAQLVIRRAGFVDQAPEEISLDYQGDRVANAISVAGDELPLENLQTMLSELRGMKRLTTSFRFEAGSIRLDAQSRSNVAQLARALEAGRYDGRSLVFIGFSDGEGAAAANLEISKRRAEVVKNAVVKASESADFTQMDIGVNAYGESMPMACDDTEWGRQVNRRVEVWVR
ncbi:substrate-binding domain-containing protein [Lentibacter algarum]|uniref:phosphate ABC transporter substrate-binding/OmpA family protein n=1 Tax=Lentibacter algarum TaxID=576131 RepID=UPI001C06944A|nr:phosphate ABC transporter substrate-binding/OmpA family protein [Lentibacter algarum]MBU2981064.1 substrate-binding domain-containing protein [Lentibacter algarum]